MGNERIKPDEYNDLLNEAEKLCSAANIINCPTIQLVPLCGLADKPLDEAIEYTARNIAAIAEIGKKYDVQFQLEPIAWSPINSLSKSLKVIKKAGKENVGMVIDFWHLWAGEETKPEEVSKLDGSKIYGVHFCDGLRHKQGTEWNEEELRGFLPGEGNIPIRKWVDAVKSTGFDGVYSSELFSSKHWEWDIIEIARETKKRMEEYIL